MDQLCMLLCFVAALIALALYLKQKRHGPQCACRQCQPYEESFDDGYESEQWSVDIGKSVVL